MSTKSQLGELRAGWRVRRTTDLNIAGRWEFEEKCGS